MHRQLTSVWSAYKGHGASSLDRKLRMLPIEGCLVKLRRPDTCYLKLWACGQSCHAENLPLLFEQG